MVTRFLLTLALFAIAASATPAQAQEPPANLQLFLLIGQSNMAGRGKVEEADKATNPRIWMLTKDYTWVLARDPLHFDKTAAGVGLGSEFARQIAAADPQVNIGLIPAAVGGTSLDQWKAGGKLYSEAIVRAKFALKSGQLAGILWHQGEADSAFDKVASYAERFATMVATLRKELGAARVPVIVGELGRFRPNNASDAFNEALPEVARKVPLCAIVTSEDLADRGDKLHFDTPSLHTFGKRYAAAYLKLRAAQPGLAQ